MIPDGAKGFAFMELTVRSKTLSTAFFVSEVQGNLSLILVLHWIHANQSVPLPCINFLFSGSAMRLRWSMATLHLSLQSPIQSLVMHVTTLNIYRAWI